MFAALLLAAALAPPPAIPRAIEAALSREGARVEVGDYRPSLPAGCAVERARVDGEVRGSGAVTVRLEGRAPNGDGCTGWALVRAVIRAKVLVTTRAVAAGEALEGAVAEDERELVAGSSPLRAVGVGSIAAWPIRAGEVLTEARVRAAGPRPGAPVPVVVNGPGFTVETPGTLVACAGERSCAVLPSGKRLAGTLRDGKLFVEAP